MSILAKAHENVDPAALVLCGGASRGALEVGFYKRLFELGVRFDMILGTSIGALNGAYIAGGMSPAELARLWQDFRIGQAVSLNWSWLLHPYRQPGFYSFNPLRRILRRTLPVTRFEDLLIPLTIVTTNLEKGVAEYWQHEGDLIEPVIASMSMPGLFTPVELGGQLHVDGGIANNVPLDQALDIGAKVAYLIECYCTDPCLQPPRGWTDILMRSFSIALDAKYQTDIDNLHEDILIHRILPKFDNNIPMMGFSQSEELIDVGYRATVAQLSRQVPLRQ